MLILSKMQTGEDQLGWQDNEWPKTKLWKNHKMHIKQRLRGHHTCIAPGQSVQLAGGWHTRGSSSVGSDHAIPYHTTGT